MFFKIACKFVKKNKRRTEELTLRRFNEIDMITMEKYYHKINNYRENKEEKYI